VLRGHADAPRCESSLMAWLARAFAGIVGGAAALALGYIGFQAYLDWLMRGQSGNGSAR
jgi:hypothetical protein